VKNRAFAALASFASLLLAGAAHAAQPYPWQMDLQPAGSAVMKEIRWFEDYTLWFIVPVTLLVLVLLIIVVTRFREKANPVASKTSHNTLIEIIWTLGPVVILFLIAIPSFQLLTNELTIPKDADMTVKATGNQWYWSYEYQGDKEVSFDSLLLKDEDRAGLGKQDKAEYPHLLAVDNELVVPVGKTVRVLVTGADVIHAFAMPAFGVKIDAVPGRMNETWFKADAEGMYYGQCSELCGKDHAFMPIAIRVVSDDQFKTWLTAAATNVGAANKALVATIDGKKTVDVAENVK
jgi:cytochrome c oxidase subunit II